MTISYCRCSLNALSHIFSSTPPVRATVTACRSARVALGLTSPATWYSVTPATGTTLPAGATRPTPDPRPCPGDRMPPGARGARPPLARALVQRAPRHRHHAAGRSHKAHPVPPSNEYRSEIEQVGFDAAGFTRPDGAYGRCDDQNAAGAQAFLYAESAAKSKPACRKSRIRVQPRPSAAILVLLVETFGSPAARRFTQPASTLPMIETDAQLRTNCRLRPRQMSCNLLLNKEVTRNWLRLCNSIQARGAGVHACSRVSRPALSRTRALQ